MNEQIPEVVSHIYWKHKQQFQLSADSNLYWVLLCIEEGTFWFRIDKVDGMVSSGDLLLCPPRKVLERKMIYPSSFHFLQLQWKKSSGAAIETMDSIPIGKIKIHNRDRLYSSYSLLKSLNGKSDFLSSLYKNHLVQDMWYLYQFENRKSFNSPVLTIDNPLMNNALEYIQRYAYTKIRLKDLSEHINLSPVQLTRQFKTAFHTTPMEYVTSLRLEKVKYLLTETSQPLSHIASACGYENEYYLSRIFTKKIKMNPSEYRRIHRL